MLVLLLLIGAGHDLWRARERSPVPAGARPVPSASMSEPAVLSLEPGTPGGAGPARDSTPRVSVGAPGPAAPPRASIDLNRAGVRELDGLPGVGPVIAGRIVLQRRRFGPFRGVDELLAVRGVGPRLLERIRPWATIGPQSGTAWPVGAAIPDSASSMRR